MAYLPTPEFLGDGADISEYVTGFRYSYGMNVFGNPNGRSRILPAGQLALNNDTGYWTEARLSALDNVVGLADSHYMGDCAVKSYRIDHYNRLVQVRLQSLNAKAYEDPIVFDTPTNYSEADVLTATGVTVTNLTDWGGWEVGAGFEYNGKLSKFLNDFGIWSDSYLIEGARGAFVAVVPSTENRSPSFLLHTPEYLAIARFAGNHYRSGWRRDAQEIQYIDSSLDVQRVTFPDGGTLSSYWSQGSGYLQSRGTGKYRAYFDLSAIFSLDQPTSDIVFITRHSLPGISDASGVKLSTAVGDGPWVTAINFNVSPGDDVQAVAFEGNWDIDIYYNPTNPITHATETVSDDESVTFGLLPPMAFPIPATLAEQVGTKLSRYADNIPQVTRLVFPLRQPNQARFDALAGLTPGDVVDIDISDGILNIGTRNHVLFMSWNYQSRARPTLEIHFVSYGALARRRVRYNTRGVDYESGKDIYYG